jgi:hypothetical protein
VNDNLLDPIVSLDRVVIARSLEERKKHLPKERHSVTSYLKCLRQQCFEWLGAEPTNIEPKDLHRNHVGNLLHEDIYQMLREDGWEVLTEHQLEFTHVVEGLEHAVRGRPDAVIKKNDYSIHLSIKTTHGKAFDYNLVKPDHVAQLSYEMRFEPMASCDKHMILYFSREDFNRQTRVMGDHFDYLDTTDVTRWKLVEQCLKEKRLCPRINENMDKYPCSSLRKGHRKVWCWYFDLCWEVMKNV